MTLHLNILFNQHRTPIENYMNKNNGTVIRCFGYIPNEIIREFKIS
jgi:hypothetical protein